MKMPKFPHLRSPFGQTVVSLTETASNKKGKYNTEDSELSVFITKLKRELRRGRDISPSIRKELSQNIYAAYRYNPIIFRGAEIPAEFVCGDEGIQYKADNSFVKQILDAHWLNPINNWTLMQHDRLRDLGLFGELCIPVSVNPKNGAVGLGNIDVDLIDAVVYDPILQMRPVAIVLNTVFGDEPYRRVYKVISESMPELLEANSVEHGRLIGLKNEKIKGFQYAKGEKVPASFLTNASLNLSGQLDITTAEYRWAGECFYFGINNPLTTTRGLSDFTSILQWADVHDEYMWSASEKAIRAGMPFIDVLIKGAGRTQIEEYRTNNPTPGPGDRVVHNEGMEIKVVTPDIKVDQNIDFLDSIKRHQLAGLGLAPHWFSEASAARAVAPEMNEPTFKHFRQRQRVYAYIIGHIFRFVIDQAIIYNRLRPPRESDYYLIFPQMSRKDQRMMGTAIKDFAAALKDMVEANIIPVETATEYFETYVKLASITIGKDNPRMVNRETEKAKDQMASLEEKLKVKGFRQEEDGIYHFMVNPKTITDDLLESAIKSLAESMPEILTVPKEPNKSNSNDK